MPMKVKGKKHFMIPLALKQTDEEDKPQAELLILRQWLFIQGTVAMQTHFPPHPALFPAPGGRRDLVALNSAAHTSYDQTALRHAHSCTSRLGGLCPVPKMGME